MENATEALLMAGSVLLFIIGLSVAMVSFTTTKNGIDNVTAYSDRETRYINSLEPGLEEEYFNHYYAGAGTKADERYVSEVTVYESLYRAMYEDVRIQFVFNGAASKWLRVEIEDQTIKKGNISWNYEKFWDAENKYNTNCFEHSIITSLRPQTTTQISYMEYLITGNSVHYPNYQNHNIEVITPLVDLLDGKRIKQYTGIYTNGDIGNEANGKEIKLITYVVE